MSRSPRADRRPSATPAAPAGTRVAAAILVLLQASLVRPAFAHPLHTTMAEITFDARTGSFRATIHAYVDDFGRAVGGLSADAAAPAQPSDSAAMAYIRSHIALTRADGRALPLTWCGIERRGDAYLICVESAGAGRMEGVRIQNRMHTDLYRDQINVVRATDGMARATLLFAGGDGAKLLR